MFPSHMETKSHVTLNNIKQIQPNQLSKSWPSPHCSIITGESEQIKNNKLQEHNNCKIKNWLTVPAVLETHHYVNDEVF